MRWLLTSLLCVTALGSVLADSCDSRRRFLVSVESDTQPAVFIWHGEEVELVCRPSNAGGCRWTIDETVLIDDCQLTTSEVGLFQCMQGDELLGSIRLRTPQDQYVDQYNGRSLYYNPGRRSIVERDSYHLCSDTGKIVINHFLCDGTRHCNNGEDEEGCQLPCGAPTAGDHSSLTAPARPLYPDGAAVTYTCDQGFGFRETLSVFHRTCRGGWWSGEPPACHRNVAFGGEGTVDGQVMSGMGLELAVDGRTETWSMLAPTTLSQSLTVPLATNASVDLVLVRTLSPQYEVALWVSDDVVMCTCNKSITDYPELTGLAACTCPGSAPGPAEVVFRSPGSTFMSLAVAEIAAFEAFEARSAATSGVCALLDRPAHGSFQSVDDASVRLVCEDGYRPSCGGAVPCRSAAGAVCRLITCPPPSAIPHAVLRANNGTGWSAVTHYSCAAGYQLYPAEQTTTAVCADGLWSLSHLSCLPDSDLRVVALRLGQQHARSVAALRGELEALLAGQRQLLRQLGRTQRRLRRLEQETGLAWEEEGEEEDGEVRLLEEELQPQLVVPPAGAEPGQANDTDEAPELQL